MIGIVLAVKGFVAFPGPDVFPLLNRESAFLEMVWTVAVIKVPMDIKGT